MKRLLAFIVLLLAGCVSQPVIQPQSVKVTPTATLPPLPKALVVPMAVPVAPAALVTWDKSVTPDVSGYRVVHGTAAGQYTDSLDVDPSVTSVAMPKADGTNYYNVASLRDGDTPAYGKEAVLLPTLPAPVTNTVSITVIIQTNSAINGVWGNFMTLPAITVQQIDPLQFYRVDMQISHDTSQPPPKP